MGKNQNHPELREGEVFLTNVPMEREGEDYDPMIMKGVHLTLFRDIPWKTKRLGGIAYDVLGREVLYMLPVFVQKAELEAAGINPSESEAAKRIQNACEHGG